MILLHVHGILKINIYYYDNEMEYWNIVIQKTLETEFNRRYDWIDNAMNLRMEILLKTIQ